MATLYRKYRPKNFKEIVNQNYIKLTLEHEIETGNIAQAYIFCGPRAVGKTTMSRVFAKAVNCLNRKKGEHEPCGKCEMCVEIGSGSSLDIIEIDAASHTGVDNVRENIISVSRISPSRAKYKVFIIDEVHMLSISAFNALLKILEEPPERVIFILCTTEIHKVPATIISRCQRFDFKRINVSDIAAKLAYISEQENIKIDQSILEAIARHSEGHMRDAESLLGQVAAIGGKKITQADADLIIPRGDLSGAIHLIGYLNKKDAASAIELLNKLIDEGIDLKRFLDEIIEISRKIFLSKIDQSLADKLTQELGQSLEEEIAKAGQGLLPKRILEIIEEMVEAKNKIKISFISQLPIEIAITKICLNLPDQNLSGKEAPRPPAPFSSAPNNFTAPNRSDNSAFSNKNSGFGGMDKNTKNISITSEELLKKWPEVLARVKKYNHSLSFILRVCQPRGVDNNRICLAFKYKFHQERINDPSIKAIMAKVFQEVYNFSPLIDAVVDEKLILPENNGNGHPQTPAAEVKSAGKIKDDKAEDDSGELINNLLKTFGGKIVK